MELTKNQAVLDWIDQQVALTKPDQVIWIDGSEAQLEQLRQEACATGEMYKLNQEKLPGCYLHRTDCQRRGPCGGPDLHLLQKAGGRGPHQQLDGSPRDVCQALRNCYDGSHEGPHHVRHSLFHGPWWVPPSPSIGIELTDSIYVVLNMAIMTRSGQGGSGSLSWTSNFGQGPPLPGADHGPLRSDTSCHFPEDNTIMSVNSGYGGNVLLGKKCFALRIASYLGKNEGWMAEHMLILGIENPQGEMQVCRRRLPLRLRQDQPGHADSPGGLSGRRATRSGCVGDDIAWMRMGADGRLWAINPENGFFGVAPGTNVKSNPNALATTQTGHHLHQRGAQPGRQHRLVGGPGQAIRPSTPSTGRATPGTARPPSKGAHPNSRFTAPGEELPLHLPRSLTTPAACPSPPSSSAAAAPRPLPWSTSPGTGQHGVFVGSIMASETTAAAAGAVGVVRRDPMAMLPFCGYHMGDYWQHWLDMGEGHGRQGPRRSSTSTGSALDDEGNFIWPGFGDNLRVLEWIIKRCFGEVDARETAIGYAPQRRGHQPGRGGCGPGDPGLPPLRGPGPLAGRGQADPRLLCPVRRQAPPDAGEGAGGSGGPPAGLRTTA